MEDIEIEVTNNDTGASQTDASETTQTAQDTSVETKQETTQEVAATTNSGDTSSEDLYELSDGRKLSGNEVVEEYKRLQADYTRKSQQLAEYNRSITNNKPTEESEEWIPETYEEIIERTKQEVFREMEAKTQAEQQYLKEISDQTDQQIAQIKAVDPNVNEGKLFQHAMKYGFRDLMVAHQNMKDMDKAIKTVADMTATNIQKRTADPVSGAPQGGLVVNDDEIYDPSMKNMSLQDMYRSIK